MNDPVNIPYSISSGFGARSAPTAGASTNHAGIDISVPAGTLATSTEAGTISEVGYNSARGNYIKVNYNSGYSAIYQHLQSALVSTGQTVKEGAALGLTGSTGISTGPHLHFEVRDRSGTLIDPEIYLKGKGSGTMQQKTLADKTKTGSGADLTTSLKSYWLYIVAALVVVGILRR